MRDRVPTSQARGPLSQRLTRWSRDTIPAPRVSRKSRIPPQTRCSCRVFGYTNSWSKAEDKAKAIEAKAEPVAATDNDSEAPVETLELVDAPEEFNPGRGGR